jgi:carbonic anhydrase
MTESLVPIPVCSSSPALIHASTPSNFYTSVDNSWATKSLSFVSHDPYLRESPTLTSPEMPIVRNIGGRTIRAITDIVGLDAVFGIKQVMIVHHTDCGMTHGTDEGMRKVTKGRVPEKYHKEVDEWKFGEIKDLTQSVVEDIKVLKDSPFIRDEIVVRGFIFDVEDGGMEEVVLEKSQL